MVSASSGSSGGLRSYAGQYKDLWYSVQGSAAEINPNTFEVEIALVFGPDYGTDSDIMSYNLYYNDASHKNVPSYWAVNNTIATPNIFCLTTAIDGVIISIHLAPVREWGGESHEDAFISDSR